MKKLNNQLVTKNYIFSALLIITIVSSLLSEITAADEVPAFFLKIAKNIPRIGRSEHQDLFVKDLNGQDDNYPWYNRLNQAISKRKVGFPGMRNRKTETWSWQHFPLAIEGPPELWRNLAGYSHDPLYRETDDFNNELWSRDKRMNDPQTQE